MNEKLQNTVDECKQHSVPECCEDAPMEPIGTRIRQERLAQGMTRPALSAISGVSVSLLGELESGRTKRTTHLRKLAIALGVSEDWLETGKGERKPSLSQPVRISLDTLASAIRLLGYLAEFKGEPSPNVSAASIIAAYDSIAEAGHPLTESNIVEFMRAYNSRYAQIAGELDGSGGRGVPNRGT